MLSWDIRWADLEPEMGSSSKLSIIHSSTCPSICPYIYPSSIHPPKKELLRKMGNLHLSLERTQLAFAKQLIEFANTRQALGRGEAGYHCSLFHLQALWGQPWWLRVWNLWQDFGLGSAIIIVILIWNDWLVLKDKNFCSSRPSSFCLGFTIQAHSKLGNKF